MDAKTTHAATETTTALDTAATEQVARATYGVWINQPLGARDVAAALASVAEHATDPAVRHWAADTHPRIVLDMLEVDFRQRAETERRALGR